MSERDISEESLRDAMQSCVVCGKHHDESQSCHGAPPRETPTPRVAHSRSEYRRLEACGVPVELPEHLKDKPVAPIPSARVEELPPMPKWNDFNRGSSLVEQHHDRQSFQEALASWERVALAFLAHGGK